MDMDKIVARARGMLLTPKREWPVAAAEPATVRSLYTGYIAILAAVPALAWFLRASVIGSGMFGVVVRVPVGMGLAAMVLNYLITLGLAYLVAWIINALAPGFGAAKDRVQALKTVAYAWTAYWLAGAAAVVPWLGWLVILAGGIYSIYLLYLGLPHTMACPPEKAGGYAAVSVILAIVLGWIARAFVGGMIGLSMYGAGALPMHGGHADAGVDTDSTLAAMGERTEQAARALESARRNGDKAAEQAAMARMMGAAMGNDGTVEALPAEKVQAFLPDTVLGMKRTESMSHRSTTLGMQVTMAHAHYADGAGQDLRLEVTDMGTAKGMMGLAGRFAGERRAQTGHGYDRTYTADGRMVHEVWDADGHGEFGVVVGQRFAVKAEGTVKDMAMLKQAVAAVDLAGLEALKDEGVRRD